MSIHVCPRVCVHACVRPSMCAYACVRPCVSCVFVCVHPCVCPSMCVSVRMNGWIKTCQLSFFFLSLCVCVCVCVLTEFKLSRPSPQILFAYHCDCYHCLVAAPFYLRLLFSCMVVYATDTYGICGLATSSVDVHALMDTHI